MDKECESILSNLHVSFDEAKKVDGHYIKFMHKVGKVSYRRLFKIRFFQWLAKGLPPCRLKNWLLRRTGMKVAPSAWISPDCILEPFYSELITIEDGVFLGWGTKLFAHVIDMKEDGYHFTIAPIVLKKNAFIGGFSTVRAGITVGEKSKIGSDSLVLHDVPDGEVWIGVPAKKYERKAK